MVSYTSYFYEQVVHDNILAVVNCGHPDLLLWRMTNDSVPNIEDYDGLPIEGSTLRFSCPNGLALIGPNLATCTENGRWELNSNNWPMCMQSKGCSQSL